MLRRFVVLTIGMLLAAGSTPAAPRQAVQSQPVAPLGTAPSPRVLQRLSRPVPRAEAVEVALGAPAISRLMRALLPEVKDLRTLRSRTLKGMAVAAAPNLPEREPLPSSLDELDWEGGVHISPISGGPVYAGPDRNYRCATITVHGISSWEGYGLAQMIRDDVTCHAGGDSSARVSLNLPGHSGLYLLSFRLSYLEPVPFPSGQIQLTASMSTWIGDIVELPFTRSPDSDALVALLEIPPDHTPIVPHADWPLEQVTLSVRLTWPGTNCSSCFGGVTVTKL